MLRATNEVIGKFDAAAVPNEEAAVGEGWI
jgi:hypothetical protein